MLKYSMYSRSNGASRNSREHRKKLEYLYGRMTCPICNRNIFKKGLDAHLDSTIHNEALSEQLLNILTLS